MHFSNLKRLTRWMMEQARRADPQQEWRTVSLVLTDDTGIAMLHKIYLNDPGVTDVLSFVYAPIPGISGQTGEIIVNVERSITEGRSRQGADNELALYIAHGCDHLTGGTDSEPALRAQMRRREKKWLQKADTLSYIKPLFKERI